MRHNVLLVFVSLLAGCASMRHAPQRTAIPKEQARAVTIFDGRSGARTTWSALVDACADADVVLIGETHSHPLGLAAAATLFGDVANQRPSSIALSLEFFTRDEQAALDDYLLGVTDEDTFKKSTHRTSGSYPPGHARMIETARDSGRPVIASNAPRRYTSVARQEGFDRLRDLTNAQRALFTIPDRLMQGPYKESFYDLMRGDPNDEEDDNASGHNGLPDDIIDGFYRAQNLWDATMAASIAHAAKSGASPVVHVVGRFHTDFNGGLTARLRRLFDANARTVTLSVIDRADDALASEDVARADFVLYVGDN